MRTLATWYEQHEDSWEFIRAAQRQMLFPFTVENDGIIFIPQLKALSFDKNSLCSFLMLLSTFQKALVLVCVLGVWRNVVFSWAFSLLFLFAYKRKESRTVIISAHCRTGKQITGSWWKRWIAAKVIQEKIGPRSVHRYK